MHYISRPRKALAALTTIAALAALPGLTGVASADDIGKQPAVGDTGGVVRVPVDDGGKQPAVGDTGGVVRVPVDDGGKQPAVGDTGGVVRVPVDEPAKEVAGADGDLQRELDSIRARVGLRRPRPVTISQEFRRLRELIEARNAGLPTNGIRAVTMGPGQLRVSDNGATRLRMKCVGNAVEACSGIVWLTTKDGSLVTQKRFRVAPGEAKNLRLVIPAGKRHDGQELTATATVHDASDAVWLVKRRVVLATA